MRLLHTADWHIGHKFWGTGRVREHEHFLKWLLQQTQSYRPDAFLVVGDVFNGAGLLPEEERVFWDFMTQLTQDNPQMRVIMSAGNHDNARYMESSLPVFHRIGVQVRYQIPVNGRWETDFEELCIPVNAVDHPAEQALVLAIPADRNLVSDGQAYGTLMRDAAKRFSGMPLVVMAHVLAKGSRIPLTGKDDYIAENGDNIVDFTSLSSKVSYMALGHIHQAQEVAGKSNVWYAGSPLSLAFSERDYSHGINIVDLGQDGSVNVRMVEYEPLRKLLTIPSDAGGSFREVMSQLSSFEKKSSGDDTALYPYVEIKMREAEISPEMLEQLQTELEGRRIKVCRMEKVMPEETLKACYADLTPDDLQRLIPGAMVREMYSQLYNGEMPEEIARMLAEVKRTCEKAERLYQGRV